MKRKNKMFLCLTLIMISTIVLVGCGMSTAQRENKLKKLLRDKYGEEFEVRELHITSGVHAWCYPVTDSSLIFEISTSARMDSITADDYLQCIVERQLDEEFQPLAEEYFGNDCIVSIDIPLGATSSFDNPNSQDIDLDSLLEYIHENGFSDRFFLYIFCGNDDEYNATKEYEFISTIGQKYQNGEMPYMILSIYSGDELFLDSVKSALKEYGWTIAIGSDSRWDIDDVIREKKGILIHYHEDGSPYTHNKELDLIEDLTIEKYKELRKEINNE